MCVCVRVCVTLRQWGVLWSLKGWRGVSGLSLLLGRIYLGGVQSTLSTTAFFLSVRKGKSVVKCGTGCGKELENNRERLLLNISFFILAFSLSLSLYLSLSHTHTHTDTHTHTHIHTCTHVHTYTYMTPPECLRA